MDEFGLIERFFRPLSPMRADVALGIGDDAALLHPSADHEWVCAVDTMVEGRHFFTDANPYDLGHKLVAVNLSDLAAMGAEPRWATLALTLPQAETDWLARFARGMGELATRFDVALVGGDTTRGPLTLTLQLMGVVPRAAALRRGGAQVGDRVVVSGYLGGAAHALALLQQSQSPDADIARCLHRPEPRVALGQRLRGLAHSCIDISDGLVADLGHLCRASGVGARIDLHRLPMLPSVAQWCQQHDYAPALFGGEDYELCFTLPESRWSQLASLDLPLPLTPIGEVVAGQGVSVLNAQGQPIAVERGGYDHFG